MSLELSLEIENVVRERAAAEGVSVNELLARAFAPNKAQTAGDPKARVQALLTRWQAEDNTLLMPPPSPHPGETPTQTLFRQWAEEDADRTDAQKKAEQRLWEEIEQGLQQNSGTLQLRMMR